MELMNYLDQHESIKKEISVIKHLTGENDVEANVKDIALHVSTLAGKIKIHLSMEDKYLYPELQKRGSNQEKTMATAFQKEMGGLADAFVLYKDQYNTVPKIMKNLGQLKSDTLQIFEKIEKRIEKEEKELYKLI